MKEDEVLKRFMEEFFPFDEFLEAGIFDEEMRGDYKAQADDICRFFGFKTIYEYGAEEVTCHISYDGERPEDEPFVTIIPSIYD